jgi:hypothetical protein
MKSLPLVLSFLPLIAFSLLTRLLPSGDVGVAALVAALCAAVAMVAVRPVWPPKVLNATSLLLFATLAALGFGSGAGDDRWLATWGGSGVGIVLGLVILVLIPVVPFTEQFARQSTPRAYWASPTFKKINRVLSAGWGVAIARHPMMDARRLAGRALGRREPPFPCRSDPGVDGFAAGAGAGQHADERTGQRDRGRHQEGGVHPAGERRVADVGDHGAQGWVRRGRGPT